MFKTDHVINHKRQTYQHLTECSHQQSGSSIYQQHTTYQSAIHWLLTSEIR